MIILHPLYIYYSTAGYNIPMLIDIKVMFVLIDQFNLVKQVYHSHRRRIEIDMSLIFKDM